MSQWGAGNGNENKPNFKYLSATGDDENLYATSGGWAIKRADGTEEVLVAIRGLDTRLGVPNITRVRFSGNFVAGQTGLVKVQFNERIVVTGTPTLAVTKGSGTVTASYTASNTQGNTLTFSFTVPASPDTLSVAAQSLVVTGATLLELADSGSVASPVITSGVATACIPKSY